MAKTKNNSNQNMINIKTMPVQAHVGSSRYENDDWGTVAFIIPRQSVQMQFADKELQYNAIYFLFGYDGTQEVVYVGQAKKRNGGGSVLFRLREHDVSNTESYRDMWQWIVVVTNKNDTWGLDELNALENAFYHEIPLDKNLNGNIPNSGGADISLFTEKIIQIKSYITSMGFQVFAEDEEVDTEHMQVQSVTNDYTIVEDLQNGMARIPEIVTPDRVVKQMVDILPEEVWNPNTKFLDPACKGGEYLREIYGRLMESESVIAYFPDTMERHEHILNEQVYGIALSQVSLERTAKRLFGHKANIRVITNYINILKGQSMGSKSDGSDKTFLDKLKEEFNTDMKFDVVIGNPPYQEIDSGNGTSSSALYQHFIELGLKLQNTRYIELIVPSRWICDLPRGVNSKWLSEFRKRKDFRKLVDFEDSHDCFNGVNIAGGVCYFLIDKEFKGITSREYYGHKSKYEWQENLVVTDDTIIRDYNKCEIVKKIICKPTLDTLMSSKTPFQKERGTQVPFDTSWVMFSDTMDAENNIKYYSKQAMLGYGYISRDIIEKGLDMVDLPKILLQTSAPTDGNVINSPIYAGKNSTCASSWAVLCNSKSLGTEEMCLNCIKYIKTKTVRFLIDSIKSTQHATKEVYKLVPLQDFTSSSDIDWSQPIADIDKQLYKKYNLTAEEIEYIESTIKPMS